MYLSIDRYREVNVFVILFCVHGMYRYREVLIAGSIH